MSSDTPNLDPETLITVCEFCLQASCWLGEFMCESARGAGTVNLRVSVLRGMERENESWWSKSIAALPSPASPAPQGVDWKNNLELLFEDYDSAMARYERSAEGEARKIIWSQVITERDRIISRLEAIAPSAPGPAQSPQPAGGGETLEAFIEQLGDLFPEPPPEAGLVGLSLAIKTLVRRYEEESREAERLRGVLEGMGEALEKIEAQAVCGAIARDEQELLDMISNIAKIANAVLSHRKTATLPAPSASPLPSPGPLGDSYMPPCGHRGYLSGSFKSPTSESKWQGPAVGDKREAEG